MDVECGIIYSQELETFGIHGGVLWQNVWAENIRCDYIFF